MCFTYRVIIHNHSEAPLIASLRNRIMPNTWLMIIFSCRFFKIQSIVVLQTEYRDFEHWVLCIFYSLLAVHVDNTDRTHFTKHSSLPAEINPAFCRWENSFTSKYSKMLKFVLESFSCCGKTVIMPGSFCVCFDFISCPSKRPRVANTTLARYFQSLFYTYDDLKHLFELVAYTCTFLAMCMHVSVLSVLSAVAF